jgi:hypothetical protein
LEIFFWHASRHEIHPRIVWRAPSWSWASVDGPIFTHSPTYRSSRGRWTNDSTILKYSRYEVLDCNVTSKGIDEYREFTSGTLRLLGSCAPVTWFHKDNRLGIIFLRFSSVYRHHFDADIPFPGAHKEAQRVGFVCLLLLRGNPHSMLWRTPLVLGRLEPKKKNIFRRIGLWRLRSEEYPEDDPDPWPAEKTEVKIV